MYEDDYDILQYERYKESCGITIIKEKDRYKFNVYDICPNCLIEIWVSCYLTQEDISNNIYINFNEGHKCCCDNNIKKLGIPYKRAKYWINLYKTVTLATCYLEEINKYISCCSSNSGKSYRNKAKSKEQKEEEYRCKYNSIMKDGKKYSDNIFKKK